jgi:aminoglycoside phosphotransferase (APT) family kinase protein
MTTMSGTVPQATAIEDHLRRASGAEVTVTALAPLGGGAVQDLLRVEVTGLDVTRLVLRSDAPQGLPGSLDRARERVVVEVARAAGVRTPAGRWPGVGLVRPGASAYFLDWVDGEALGRRVVSAPALAAARAALGAQLAQELAKLHAITPQRRELIDALGLPPANPLQAQVRALRSMADGLREPRPAVEVALAWLAARAAERPASPVVLVHGDFRTGNFLVREDGLAAVLDWEFARWSAPEEDLAWLCVRDWRFGQLALAAGGVARRADFFRAYAQASGREVDGGLVRTWEVLGNVRWALGCLAQGARYAQRPDLELAAIARRAPEMEWEALRLIEEAP